MTIEELVPDRLDEPDEFWARFNTADGVFAVDSQQRITHWSAGAQKLLGYRPEDVIGKRCFEVVGGRDARNFRFCRRDCPVVVNARRGRPTQDYDILCALPTGEEKWLNVSILLSKQGRRGAPVIHLIRDVSQRRRIEEFARKVSDALQPILTDGQNDPVASIDPNPTPQPRLSRREMEVLRLLATGMGTKQIADALSIRTVTARNHISNLLTKLGVESRLQAVAYASQRRMI